MFCSNCGRELIEGSRYCSYCGNEIVPDYFEMKNERDENIPNVPNPRNESVVYKTSDNREFYDHEYAGTTMKKHFWLLRITAFLLVVCVLLIPMINIEWEGLMPTGNAWTVASTFAFFLDEGLKALHYCPILLHLASWIPAILLFLFSIGRLKALSILSALFGIVLPGIVIIRMVLEYGASACFNFTNGCICIGYYVSILLNLICLAFVISARE